MFLLSGDFVCTVPNYSFFSGLHGRKIACERRDKSRGKECGSEGKYCSCFIEVIIKFKNFHKSILRFTLPANSEGLKDVQLDYITRYISLMLSIHFQKLNRLLPSQGKLLSNLVAKTSLPAASLVQIR